MTARDESQNGQRGAEQEHRGGRVGRRFYTLRISVFVAIVNDGANPAIRVAVAGLRRAITQIRDLRQSGR